MITEEKTRGGDVITDTENYLQIDSKLAQKKKNEKKREK